MSMFNLTDAFADKSKDNPCGKNQVLKRISFAREKGDGSY